jgi:VanZ family protein
MRIGPPKKDFSALLQEFFPPFFFAATIAYCVFIYCLSSVSSFPISSPFPQFDKAAHFCLYGGLAGVITLGLRNAGHRYSGAALFIIPVGFSVLYGLSDETHQLFVDGRFFDLGDAAADMFGAVFAFLLVLFIYQRKRS